MAQKRCSRKGERENWENRKGMLETIKQILLRAVFLIESIKRERMTIQNR